VVEADAQTAAGLAFERLADPAHGLHGRVIAHMHVGGGEQAATRLTGPCREPGPCQRGEAGACGEQLPAPHGAPSRGPAASTCPLICPWLPKSTRTCWPTRTSWMPVALPVAIRSPALSGRPRRAERDSAKA